MLARIAVVHGRHSLPMALAFATTAGRPTALLTGAVATAGTPNGLTRLLRPAATHDMVRAGLDRHALSATAALVWNGDLPRLPTASRNAESPRSATGWTASATAATSGSTRSAACSPGKATNSAGRSLITFTA